MKKIIRIFSVFSLIFLLGSAVIPVSAAAETAKEGSTMLGGDWKAINGDWKYENGVFSATGGKLVASRKIGLQFNAVTNIRDFEIEYEVPAIDTGVDNDDVCLTFRTPLGHWLGGKDDKGGGGYCISTNKWGISYMDMRNWATDTQYGQQVWGAHLTNFPDLPWKNDSKFHKIKLSTKGARVYLTVDGLDRQSISVTGGGDTSIDNDFKNGCINLVFGTAGNPGTAFVPNNRHQVKNLKITVTDNSSNKVVYSYTESGVSRPGGNNPVTTTTVKPGDTTTIKPEDTTTSTKAGDPTVENVNGTTLGENDTTDTNGDTNPAGEGDITEDKSGITVPSKASITSKTSDKKGLSGGIIALIVVVVLAVGGGVAAFFILKKKKSSEL